MTRDDLRLAVEQLAQSRKGLSALRHLLTWLEDDGLGLDATNQQAVLVLLAGAWGGFAGSAVEFIREYL